MNRKSLARTSSQPGKTQTINFYNKASNSGNVINATKKGV